MQRETGESLIAATLVYSLGYSFITLEAVKINRKQSHRAQSSTLLSGIYLTSVRRMLVSLACVAGVALSINLT